MPGVRPNLPSAAGDVSEQDDEGSFHAGLTELAAQERPIHLRDQRRADSRSGRHRRERAPIPIGKLQLYTACAGVPPEVLLPIHLDIGTTNAALCADPLYLGLRETPPSAEEVDAIVDAFMEAANTVFPGVCVHFEDWKGTDAIRLLKRYQDKYLVYNDDIQGTAGVTIAGLITALQIKHEKLTDQRILFAGAGSAGIGIGNMIVEAMMLEGVGESAAPRRSRCSTSTDC
ncbi:MAG: malic enzyme-like NAD(P)-binding protein [Pirellulales bacterium]